MKRLRLRWRHGLIIAAILAAHLIFPRYVVATGSMRPTIPPGSYVLACRIPYWFSGPSKGDIVVFTPAKPICEFPWIHRIVGEPGTRIPEAAKDRAPSSRSDLWASAEVPSIIPEGYFYQSGDSTKSYHGLVPRSQIMAKVLFHFQLPWSSDKAPTP